MMVEINPEQYGIVAVNVLNVCSVSKKVFNWHPGSTFIDTFELYILYKGSDNSVTYRFRDENELNGNYLKLTSAIINLSITQIKNR